MQIGLIGLGKMGSNLALNFKKYGHQVLAYDLNKSSVEKIKLQGVHTVSSVSDLALSMPGRKIIWLMVPSGQIVDVILGNLKNHLHQDDIIIDGGNSHYKDSIRRAKELSEVGVQLLDCGTCGGVSTVGSGLSLAIGGKKEAFDFCQPIFQAISKNGGFVYAGISGNGHFVKLVHNGIEYGMLQAIAEGMELLMKHNDINVSEVAKAWNTGSLIEGKLMEFTQKALEKDPTLNSVKAVAHHSTEGKWPAETALELGVPAPVMTLSLLMRYRSQQDDSFATRFVSALRGAFGGHAVEQKD
jgi:6-phosphogluconate dehydrogenase